MSESQSSLDLNRRRFIKFGGAAGAAVAFMSPLEALARTGARRGADGYGALAPAIDETTGLPLIQLPKGFRYRSFGWTGDVMDDGVVTPGGHDGGAALLGFAGRTYYVRNHELRYSATGLKSSFASPDVTYDAGGAPGGTTTLLFDENQGRLVRSWASLGGTIRNCAGGPTPWNSWLTCEETLDDPTSAPAAGLKETHGWVFDVPARRRARPVPLKGLGRFNHEAAAVDPLTGVVYETEDKGSSGLYRFVPKRWGRLAEGGRLEMLKVKDKPQLDTSKSGIAVGATLQVEWVPIADPERKDDVAGDGLGVFAQGFAQGGASFERGEGIWYGNGRLYFTATSGGAANKGQVWELDPRRDTLKLLYESPAQAVLDNPDNIAVSPRGGLLLCEDGGGDTLFLRGLTTKGEIFDFAQNNIVLDGEVNGFKGDFRDQEWAGASWSPNGRWLLVSIQTPGVTFAITGPWRAGSL